MTKIIEDLYVIMDAIGEIYDPSKHARIKIAIDRINKLIAALEIYQ